MLELQQIEDAKLVQLQLTVNFEFVECLDSEKEEGSFVGLCVDSLKKEQFGAMWRN